MLALVPWQINWTSNPTTTNMVFTKYLPSFHFTFYAVSKLPDFVQNIAPFTHSRCFWKALFVSSTAKTCSNRSFEFRGHVISQMAVISLECGWDGCSILDIFWGLGAKGCLTENCMKTFYTVSRGRNVGVCYLRYGFSVSNDIINMYCTLKLAYCKCMLSSKAGSVEQLVCLNLDFRPLPITFLWVWWKHKLHHWK